MFNPFEYSVTKSNTYDERPRNNADTPQGEFFKSGSQTLKLNLTFDTYESGEDVSQEKEQIMEIYADQNAGISPPKRKLNHRRSLLNGVFSALSRTSPI